MTDKQWYWLGEFGTTLIGFGFLYVVMRLTNGRSHGPLKLMSPLAQVASVLLLALVASGVKTWLHFRRLEKRRARRAASN